jgi:hypothetical protein
MSSAVKPKKPAGKKKLKNTSAKGAKLENRVKHYFQGQGYLVIRSAASKGVADLVALSPDTCLVIQCKAGKSKITATERKALEKLFNDCNGDYLEVKVCTDSYISTYDGDTWNNRPYKGLS